MKRLIIFSFFMVLSMKCFAQQDLVMPFEKEQISKLIKNNDYSIIFMRDSTKIYLNPDALRIGEKGVFLEDEEGILYEIPSLFTSESGIYTFSNSRQSDSTIYPIIKCKSCRKPFNPNIFNKGICPYCNTQN